MFESLFATADAATTPAITLVPFLVCIGVSLALGCVLALIYAFRSRHTKSFMLTLAVLPAIVCVVIAMVNGNVGAGVAVAGAFSLVRFRSVAGSARDICFVFLAMCVGLACGMGYTGYATLTCIVVGGATIVYQLIDFGGGTSPDRTLRITVPEDLDYTTLFDEPLAAYTTYHELLSVKTTNMGSLYRLVYNIGLRTDKSERDFIDELRCRNGNLEVAITRQEANNEEL